MNLPNNFISILDYDPNTGLVTKNGLSAGSVYTNKDGSTYFKIWHSGKTYNLHRVVWELHYKEVPDGDIDHLDGDGTNNKINNLRCVSKSINQRNQKRSTRNKSGVSGVCWRKSINKYEITATVNKKLFNLGYTPNLFEAACIRKSFNNKNGFTERHG